jgi:hypothetical protein
LVVSAAIVYHTGTSLVLINQPDLAFQDGNPLRTTDGELVIENLVALAAAVAVSGRPPPQASRVAS